MEFIVEPAITQSKVFMESKDYKGKYKNKSLEVVLKAISFSYGFEYEINNKTVRIKSLKEKGGIN